MSTGLSCAFDLGLCLLRSDLGFIPTWSAFAPERLIGIFPADLKKSVVRGVWCGVLFRHVEKTVL